MIKTFTTNDIVSLTQWYNSIKENEPNKFDNFSVALQWGLRQNIKKFLPIAEEYLVFKDEMENKIKSKYATEEMSEIVFEVDENGNKIETQQRKVKDEFIPEYQKELEGINSELRNLLNEKNEIDIKVVDIDSEIEKSFSDKNPTMEDIDLFDILTFMQE